MLTRMQAVSKLCIQKIDYGKVILATSAIGAVAAPSMYAYQVLNKPPLFSRREPIEIMVGLCGSILAGGWAGMVTAIAWPIILPCGVAAIILNERQCVKI
jgi:hypothetical protein